MPDPDDPAGQVLGSDGTDIEDDNTPPDPEQLAGILAGAMQRLAEPAQIDDMEVLRRRRAARGE